MSIINFMRDKRIIPLGFNVKIERQRRKLTQEQVAESANISKNTLIAIEGGRQVPSCLVLYDIAKVLGVPMEEFYKGLE